MFFEDLDPISLQNRGVLLNGIEMNALCLAICRFWQSSIGKKLIVAVTGIILVGFLIAHVSGNMLIFAGREAMNDYAYFLHHFLHGAGIWIFRGVLVVAFVLHIVATIALTKQNRAAKVESYQNEATNVASKSSRMMIWSGLTVLAFVVFHIFHFTVRVDPELAGMKEPSGRHDVWGMVIVGFQKPPVVLFYFVGISLLCSHLSHGIASIFQTLGWRSRKSSEVINKLGLALSVVVWLGFLSIPLAASVVGFGTDEMEMPVTDVADVAEENR